MTDLHKFDASFLKNCFFRPLTALVPLIFFCSFLLSPLSFAAQLNEQQQALLEDYRQAGKADDEAAMTAAWEKILQDENLVRHIQDDEGQLAAHYYSRYARRADNAAQRQAAADGEIIPFDEVQARAENSESYEPSGAKAVTGDPELADLADPSRKHVSAPVDPEYQNQMAKAREANALRLEAQRKSQAAVTRPRTNSSDDIGGQNAPTRPRDAGSGSSAKLGASSEKPSVSDEILMLPAGKEAPKMLPAPEERLLLPEKSSVPEAPQILENQSIKKPSAQASDVAGEEMPVSAYMEAVTSSDAYKNTKGAFEKAGRLKDQAELAGYAADGYRKEAEEAALQGREFSAVNAAAQAAYDYAGGQQYELSRTISEKELERARKQGYSEEEALLRSMGENVRVRIAGAYESTQKIQEEAAQAEIERAQAAGEAASAVRAKLNAAGTLAANSTGMTQVFDAVTYDDNADRQMAETGRKLQQKAKETLEADLIKTGELERRINDLVENWDTSDPSIRAELDNLKQEHNRQRESINTTVARLKNNPAFDSADPEYEALRQAAVLLPEDPESEAREAAVLRAEAIKLISECNFDHVYGVMEMLPYHQGRPQIETALQSAILRENKTTELFENAKFQMSQKNAAQALSLLHEAAANTQCSASRIKIEGIVEGIQKETAAAAPVNPPVEAAVRLDCRGFGPAAVVWNPEQQAGQCACYEGYVMNAQGTACVSPLEAAMAAASCEKLEGSYKEWDSAKQKVICVCPEGTVKVRSKCKPVRKRVSREERQQTFGPLANSLMSMQRAQGDSVGSTYQGNQTDFQNTIMNGGQYAQQNSAVSSMLTSTNTYAPVAGGSRYTGYTGPSNAGNSSAAGQSKTDSSPCADLSQYSGKAIVYSPTPCGHIFRGVAYGTYEQARAAFDAAQKREGASFYR